MFVDDPTRLRLMLDAARGAARYTRGRVRVDMDEDVILSAALIQFVEKFSRASVKLSGELKARHRAMNWAEYSTLAQHISDNYAHADLDRIWDAAAIQIPASVPSLRVALREALEQAKTSNGRRERARDDRMASPIDGPTLADFCRRNRIHTLSVFGSYARGQSKPESDLDLLAEFDPDTVPNLMGLVGMEDELKDMAGREVDLHLPHELNKYIRRRVLREARPIFGG
jgi:uncharacterized protein